MRITPVLRALAAAAVLGAARSNAAKLVEVAPPSPNPGRLVMFKAVPQGLPAGSPLVIVRHGCTQRARDFDDESGWLELAERLRASNACGIDRTGLVRRPPTLRSAEAWRDLLAEAAGAVPASGWPAVSLWHGSDDPTVHPENLQEGIEQWTAAHGIDQAPDNDGAAAPHRRAFTDRGGETKVEAVLLPCLGHAVPGDPGSGAGQCGRTAPHFVDIDICAAGRIARFWKLDASP